VLSVNGIRHRSWQAFFLRMMPSWNEVSFFRILVFVAVLSPSVLPC
jgi:hypothetical protein